MGKRKRIIPNPGGKVGCLDAITGGDGSVSSRVDENETRITICREDGLF
jgi:hypothetical protein